MKNPHNVVNRSVKAVVDVIKDSASKSITNAYSNGVLKVEKAELVELLHIVASSIDHAYHRSSREIDVAVNQILEEIKIEAQK